MMQYANDPKDAVTFEDVHRLTNAVIKLSRILGMEYFANITLWDLRNAMTNLTAELESREDIHEDAGTGDDAL
jgi:hypothetical protein